MTSTEAMNTEVALLKQSNKIMQTDIKEVKKNLKEHSQDQKDGFDKLENKIEHLFDNLDKKFATKGEHKENKTKIESFESDINFIKKLIWTFGTATGLTVLGAVLKLVIK